MYLNIVTMQVLRLFTYYEDKMTSIVQGDAKIEFYEETDCIKDRIGKRTDHYFPTPIADLIAFFADEYTVYFSISIKLHKISQVCTFSADFLELAARYWYNPSSATPPALLLSPQDFDDELFPSQRRVVQTLADISRHHKDQLHVIHDSGTGCSFTRSGYVIQGNGTGLPHSPTTTIAGYLVLGRYAVGKRYAVLAALAEAKARAPPLLTPFDHPHPGRTFSKGMVIITTSEKIAAWKRELERGDFVDWSVLYVDTWECLRDKMHLLPTADLILVNRRAVDHTTRKWMLENADRYLWTTLFSAVVVDDVFSLMSRVGTRENIVHITREALILKTLFVGHCNILIASETHGQEVLSSKNFLDLCAFLVGVTVNGAYSYPPPLSFQDKVELEGKVFGSISHHFPVAEKSKAAALQHFISHHVLRMTGHEATEPELLTLNYHHVSSNILETHTTIPPVEIHIMNDIVNVYRARVPPNYIELPDYTALQAALIKVLVYILSQANTEVVIYRRGKGDSINEIRGFLVTHGIQIGIDGFDDRRYDLKRKRYDVKESLKNVAILHDDDGEETHLRSVTHIIAIGGDSHSLYGEINFAKFVERATRYGLMSKKPIVLIKLVENRGGF